MAYATVNSFRKKRGEILRAFVADMSQSLGRKIKILDVGGREDYWGNVGIENIEVIDIINYSELELDNSYALDPGAAVFRKSVGDARNLSAFPDQSYDLVHSNSVIEHVGRWPDMRAMADEAMRVGRAGWIQTPAWSFPVEPHFRTPFMHWFGRPAQARLMSLSFDKRIRALPLDRRRRRIDNINLLSKQEVAELFPRKIILTERVLFVKSYIVTWKPN